jgi:hypothetical protein
MRNGYDCVSALRQASGAKPEFSVAYAITSNGRDAYADMGLVSMLSVRLTNPGLRILAVCDAASAQNLRSANHRMLDVCDELVAVDTPEGDPTFRNRCVKAQLGLVVSGLCLYLDADMLVRRDLSALPSLVTELGGVANNNAEKPVDRMWVGDREFMQRMGWLEDLPGFINGGMQFFHPCPAVTRFYEEWSRLYVEGVRFHENTAERSRGQSQLTIYWQDQPSLNLAIVRSGVQLDLLPSAYNFQIGAGMRGCSEAAIWHFWYALESAPTCFNKLLAAASSTKLPRLQSMVRKAIASPYPYANQDFLGRRIGRKIESADTTSTFEKLWLTDRRAALRFWAGGVKARLGRRSAV